MSEVDTSNLRFRIYRWMYDRPGVVIRWAVFSLAVVVVWVEVTLFFGSLFVRLEMRWGLVVWYSFCVGDFGVVSFNVATNLMGLGYQDWLKRKNVSIEDLT